MAPSRSLRLSRPPKNREFVQAKKLIDFMTDGKDIKGLSDAVSLCLEGANYYMESRPEVASKLAALGTLAAMSLVDIGQMQQTEAVTLQTEV